MFWDDIASWFNPQPEYKVTSPYYGNTSVQPNVTPTPSTGTRQTASPMPGSSLWAANDPTSPFYGVTGSSRVGNQPDPTTSTPYTPSTNAPSGGNPYEPGTVEWLLWSANQGGAMGTPTPEPITPWQQAQLDWEKSKYASDTQSAERAAALRQQQFLQEQTATDAYRQQQLSLQQQQMAQEQARYQAGIEAEKQQRLATLSAQPKSWLEYAALSNQAPVVQPWMMGLNQGRQQVGEQIQGWNSTNMTGMQDLIDPSTQYLARMGPTAKQQYYGYQQANLAQTPEETEWRLWSQGPPSGQNKALQAVR